MKRLYLSITLLVLHFNLHAQYSFEHYNKSENLVNVIENGKQLNMPFNGGLKLPQFSSCDLNLDGKNDLVVFDKDKSRVSTFLNIGGVNEIKYKYAPEYIKHFPIMNNWVIMVDYNMDGKMDIFTSHPSGIKVYKNTSNINTGLAFEIAANLLYVDYGTIVSNLNVAPSDIPAIIDLDNDGDIDVLHFIAPIDSSGESIYWYKNIGKENYNSSDSLKFIVAKRCWGQFRESQNSCNININYPVGICSIGGKEGPPITNSTMHNRHEGATTNIFDATGDGVVDVFIGDPACNSITMLVNGATNTEAIMTQKITNFPTSRPISINTFLAVFNIDVNNDGLKDIIGVPNSFGGSDNIKHVQLYLNNGTVGLNRYDFETDEFLINEMIDVGDGASPAFVDYNNDGLMDLIISNLQYSLNGITTTGLALYKNIGDANIPKFELISRDWNNFSSLNINSMAPCFGDVDMDGDLDMVCGANDGTIYYFQNVASTGNAMNLQYIPNFFGNIDVGNHSSPSLFDFNGDGKLELIVGRKTDNFRLYENTGTLNAPNYTLASDSLYKINLKKYLVYPSGRGQMHISSLRANETPRVIISNGNGKLYILGEVSTDYNKVMDVPIDSINLYSGYFSDITGGFNFSLSDLNNDAKPEIVVGTPQGGLFLFRNTSVNVGVNNFYTENYIHLFPNPANTFININTANNDLITALKLYDINGRLIKELSTTARNINMNVEELNAGIYFIQIQTENTIATKKISINR